MKEPEELTADIREKFSILKESTDYNFCSIIGMFNIAHDETGIIYADFENLLLHNKREFNNGCCTAFTSYFGQKIKTSKIEDSTMHMELLQEYCDIDYGRNYHEFLKIDDHFYDIECVKGVSNLVDLPFFKRLIKK